MKIIKRICRFPSRHEFSLAYRFSRIHERGFEEGPFLLSKIRYSSTLQSSISFNLLQPNTSNQSSAKTYILHTQLIQFKYYNIHFKLTQLTKEQSNSDDEISSYSVVMQCCLCKSAS